MVEVSHSAIPADLTEFVLACKWSCRVSRFCRKSLVVEPSTRRMRPYPDSWQKSKKRPPNSSRIVDTGTPEREDNLNAGKGESKRVL